MGAAVQAYFFYPETCGKTLEEIEVMFSKGGPHPWNTKPGGSRLDAEIEAVRDRKAHGGDGYEASVPHHGGTNDPEKSGAMEHVERTRTADAQPVQEKS